MYEILKLMELKKKNKVNLKGNPFYENKLVSEKFSQEEDLKNYLIHCHLIHYFEIESEAKKGRDR